MKKAGCVFTQPADRSFREKAGQRPVLRLDTFFDDVGEEVDHAV